MRSQQTVVVVGATGYLGMETCRQLSDASYDVRGIVRNSSNEEKIYNLQQLGVEIITADIKDEASLYEAFEGADAVISTASSTLSRQEGDSIETVDHLGQLNVIAAAEKAGVKKFVFISVCPMNEKFPLQDAKRAVEKRLMSSKMDYTILQPTMFMEVWLSPALGFDVPNGSVTIYGNGDKASSWISLRDVASFAIASLNNDKAGNQVFELGGPEALTPEEVISQFEEISGKKIDVRKVPVEALREQKSAASDPLTESFAALMIAYATGSPINMEKTLTILPVECTTVREYAKLVMPESTVAV
jgi:NADH dehydrogenase